jgi:hypothetical protein
LSTNSLPSVAPAGSLPFSQKPTASRYPAPQESNALSLSHPYFYSFVYLTTLTSSEYRASNDRTINRIGNIAEGSGRGLIQSIIIAVAWETEKNHERHVMMAGRWVEIWTGNLPNIDQSGNPADRQIRSLYFVMINFNLFLPSTPRWSKWTNISSGS